MIPNGLMQLPNWQDPNQPPQTPPAPAGLQGLMQQQSQQPAPQATVQPVGYDPLALIEHHESGGRNVPNYRFDPTHTAQGYYQITNSNWKTIAPKLGIDTSLYPDAISAPKDVQRQVAAHMYSKGGFNDWAPYNPALKAAVAQAGGPEAFDAPTVGDRYSGYGGSDSPREKIASGAAPPLPDPVEVGSGGKIAGLMESNPLANQPTDGTAIGDATGKDEVDSPLSKDKGFNEGLGMIAKGAKGATPSAQQPIQNPFANEMMQGNPMQMGMMQSLVAKAMASNPKFSSGLFNYNPKRTA